MQLFKLRSRNTLEQESDSASTLNSTLVFEQIVPADGAFSPTVGSLSLRITKEEAAGYVVGETYEIQLNEAA